MKKLLLVLCGLALTACGGHDKKSNAGETPVGNEQPQVNVPADAMLTDYSCDHFEEVSENGGPIHPKAWNYKGLERAWREGEFSLYFSEDADGLYKTLSRQKTDVYPTGERHNLNYTTEWTKTESSWTKRQATIESLYTYDAAGKKNYLYRRVDGRDSPAVWEFQTSENGPKSYRIYSRHLNPSLLNRDGRIYSRVEETCIYTDR